MFTFNFNFTNEKCMVQCEIEDSIISFKIYTFQGVKHFKIRRQKDSDRPPKIGLIKPYKIGYTNSDEKLTTQRADNRISSCSHESKKIFHMNERNRFCEIHNIPYYFVCRFDHKKRNIEEIGEIAFCFELGLLQIKYLDKENYLYKPKDKRTAALLRLHSKNPVEKPFIICQYYRDDYTLKNEYFQIGNKVKYASYNRTNGRLKKEIEVNPPTNLFYDVLIE